MNGSGRKMVGYGAGAAGLALFIDQLSKIIIRHSLAVCGQGPADACEQVRVAPFLSILRTGNTGSALGFAQGLWLWTVLAAAAIVLVLLTARRAASSRATRTACGLVIGGALGNVLDRLAFGSVTDFLAFNWGPDQGVVINVADIALAIGIGIAASIAWIRIGRPDPVPGDGSRSPSRRGGDALARETGVASVSGASIDWRSKGEG